MECCNVLKWVFFYAFFAAKIVIISKNICIFAKKLVHIAQNYRNPLKNLSFNYV